MLNAALTKISNVFSEFKNNLLDEYNRNRRIKDSISLPICSPIKQVYKGLQFSDFLLGEKIFSKNSSSDLLPYKIRKSFFCDFFSNIKYDIKNYMKNGIKNDINCNIKCNNDYKVLCNIEEIKSPTILRDFLEFKENNFTKEMNDGLKELRNDIISKNEDLEKIELSLVDFRMSEIESVSVKNMKKTIKNTFEFTAKVKSCDIKRYYNYNGAIEYIKDNEEWSPVSFVFKEL